MKKIQIEFAAFKEKQEALNESLKERFHSIEEKYQSLRRQTEENNVTISAVVQIQSIRNELVVFEERIRDLEALNQAKNANVILIFKMISLNLLKSLSFIKFIGARNR